MFFLYDIDPYIREKVESTQNDEAGKRKWDSTNF